MNEITLYASNVRGLASNTKYNRKISITNLEMLRKALSVDYVPVYYKDNTRSIKNFISSNCIIVDLDNDHSDNEADFIDINKVKEAFPDVRFYVHYSRNNMKPKNDKSPRPKFHIIFFCNEITDEKAYSKLKQEIYDYFPYIDNNALDSARFFFGTENPQVEYVNGELTIDEFIKDKKSEEFLLQDRPIVEGTRNANLHKSAVKILKRYGNTDESYSEFLKLNERCSPPLEDSELNQIWSSALKYYKDKIETSPDYVKPEEYEIEKWDEVIPLDERPLVKFPLEVLPDAIKNYCLAVSEATQTPIDMAGVIALALLALSMQRKYQIAGKHDWIEPLNLYVMVVAEPSERKSVVINQMIKVIHAFETNYNEAHALEREKSEIEYQSLIAKRNKLVRDVEKGKTQSSDLDAVITEINGFNRLHKLILTVDDVTPEILANKLKEQDESLSIFSSEGGIFDIISGAYSKIVNIDILLKAYSGDFVRVDRIGRESISLKKPKLTILLMVQPKVLENIMNNSVFSGRGLNARFLYSIPESKVETRKLSTIEISDDIKQEFYRLVNSILNEDTKFIDTIELSDDAYKGLENFHDTFEVRLKTELKNIGAWAGKLVGNILRISGLLTRAREVKYDPFLNDGTPDKDGNYIVQKDVMLDAIKLGEYFLEHALYAFNALGNDSIKKNAKAILNAIIRQEHHLTEITPRDIQRMCRQFKKDDLPPVLDLLCDYGYLKEKEFVAKGVGRSKGTIYLINPAIYNTE